MSLRAVNETEAPRDSPRLARQRDRRAALLAAANFHDDAPEQSWQFGLGTAIVRFGLPVLLVGAIIAVIRALRKDGCFRAGCALQSAHPEVAAVPLAWGRAGRVAAAAM
jgi:hypothetical protein